MSLVAYPCITSMRQCMYFLPHSLGAVTTRLIMSLKGNHARRFCGRFAGSRRFFALYASNRIWQRVEASRIWSKTMYLKTAPRFSPPRCTSFLPSRPFLFFTTPITTRKSLSRVLSSPHTSLNNSPQNKMAEQFGFQAEISQLLDLIISK